MENKLETIKLTNEGKIKSTELVEIINVFREEEGKNPKEHSDFMKKIKKEIETLKSLGLNKYIIESSYIDKKGEKRPCYELTKEGVKYIIDLYKSKDKIALQKVYEYMGGDYSKTVCIDRFETTFFNKLKDTLLAMNIDIDTQKCVLGKYRLDGYIEKYNLVIEYDEEQHFVEPQKSKDIKRQKEIKNKFGYEFIRLNYKNSDSYNIGLVMNYILKCTNK